MSEHTILFVDDEENILKTIIRLFLDEEYRIITATSGKEALAMIDKGEDPSVIVSDQRMPEMGGAEFLAKAKEKLPQAIRMVLTGYADINAAVDAINLGGINRYILKPWNDEDLKLSVKKAVERFELVEQNKLLTKELKEKNDQLSRMNDVLEEKVRERTLELEKSLNKNKKLNVALGHKVKELKGRDRIQQLLMTIHPLEETLTTILEVIAEVIPLDAAAIFLTDQLGEDVRVGATFCDMEDANKLFVDSGRESTFASYKTSLFKVISSGKPALLERTGMWVNEKIEEKVQFALFPVRKGNDSLGAIVVVRASALPFSESNIRTISSFSIQASVAISDSLLRQELPSLKGVLDDVLSDLPG